MTVIAATHVADLNGWAAPSSAAGHTHSSRVPDRVHARHVLLQQRLPTGPEVTQRVQVALPGSEHRPAGSGPRHQAAAVGEIERALAG